MGAEMNGSPSRTLFGAPRFDQVNSEWLSPLA